jgi:hypothetical protein
LGSSTISEYMRNHELGTVRLHFFE